MNTKQITTDEAIRRLREMQSQIIHGSNTFGEIADAIESLRTKAAILRGGLRAVVGASEIQELEMLRAITEPMVEENENAKAGICGIVALLKASDI